ncbi:MAG TPA: nucleotidyltransferase family protein [Anaerolineales bacterium]|nr:nucleotidyltransferase family protein [Anaerolineales bacterium]
MLKGPLEDLFISPDQPIRVALEHIDRGGLGIALVVDEERHLIGTISDGDIRRAMLASIDLESPTRILLERKAQPYFRPITAQIGTSREILLGLMKQYVLREIPLLDIEDRVVDVVGIDELIPAGDLHMQAVIMAGGKGSRLRPLTEDLPKPMLPVGGRPLMEVLLEQLHDSGIRRVNITTHYRPEKITEYFGNGESMGVELNYVNEQEPLGTGGALSLIPQPTEPMLVINGDILTRVNFRTFLAFHQENHADMTVAVRRYEIEVPYGVVDCDGVQVRGLREKPRMDFFVNAGIYMLEPVVFQYIPHGEHFNMTDLIQRLLDVKRTVVSFPVREYWLDIGQHAEYAKAQEDVINGLAGSGRKESLRPKKEPKGKA